MRRGFVVVDHLLACCTRCGRWWHCNDPDCRREACCLGGNDCDTDITERLNASGWTVGDSGEGGGGQVICAACAGATGRLQ